ncbi:MAG: hypothetical protein KDD34_05610 [Bdellovibrionales bacterium]|nr:hypothetical protein [Bdellovibrionales bacterium]
MKTRYLAIFAFNAIVISTFFIFQNCSKVNFETSAESAKGSNTDTTNITDTPENTGASNNNTDSRDTTVDVCNPLDPQASCYQQPDQGLVGNLYYLTDSHASLFHGDLNNAKIDDYSQYGILVPVNIVMTTFDVTPRPWSSGFHIPSGEIVRREDGNELFEWFHLDLTGKIHLPDGSYQFATLSDDGMRITIDGNVIINHDGVHAPTWKCASSMVTFSNDESKNLRVQYFQGPRYQIAMQLLVRPASESSNPCGDNGGFQSIGAEAFSN